MHSTQRQCGGQNTLPTAWLFPYLHHELCLNSLPGQESTRPKISGYFPIEKAGALGCNSPITALPDNYLRITFH